MRKKNDLSDAAQEIEDQLEALRQRVEQLSSRSTGGWINDYSGYLALVALSVALMALLR